MLAISFNLSQSWSFAQIGAHFFQEFLLNDELANLALPAASVPGQQSVDAALVVFENPQPNHAIAAAEDVGDIGTIHPTQQSAHGCQSNVAALVGRRLHRRLALLQKWSFRLQV